MTRKPSKVTVKDLGWKETVKRLEALGRPYVTIGVHQENIERQDDKGGSAPVMAIVASVHEFGSDDGRIPERSYLRSTIDGRRNEIATVLERMESQVVAGKVSPTQALGVVGQWVQGAVQKTITDLDDPPLAPATIKSRRYGGDNPLVDTGQLRAAIRYEVSEGQRPKEDK